MTNAKTLFVCVLTLSSALILLRDFQKDTPNRTLHNTPIRKLHTDYSDHNLDQKEKYGSFNHVVLTRIPKKCSGIGEDKMYAFGGEIYDAIGETELQQYIRFKKYNPKFKFIMNNVKVAKPPAGYSYHVKALSSTDILIEERNGETPTGGGSSFLVRSDSVSTQICQYDDFFNGTYVAHCPLPECTCRNISVLLQYFNFTAYTSNHLPIKKLIWRQRSCNLHKGYVGLTLTDYNMNTSTNGENIVTWYLTNKQWVARSISGKEFTQMSKSELCGCIKKIRKLFCFGASHMRFKSDYIMSTCYKVRSNVPQKYLSLTVENVHFLSVTKMFEYPPLWRKYLKNETLGRRDVVLIQIGAHDMGRPGIQQTMASVMKFVGVLSDLQKKSLKYGFRLLFVTTPPFPEAYESTTKGSRNNFALAALNRRLKTELSLKKVTVFDEFSVLLAQQENNACGCHYLCRRTEHNMTSIYGKVGMIAASMMVSNNIC